MSFKPCSKPHTAKEAIMLLDSVSVFSSSPGHHRSLSKSRHTSKPFVLFHRKRATSRFNAHITAHDSSMSFACRFRCPSVLHIIVSSLAMNDSYTSFVLRCNLEFPVHSGNILRMNCMNKKGKIEQSLLLCRSLANFH